MRARGVRSPDEWDSVALTFAEPVRERNRDVANAISQYVRSTPSSGNSSGGWMGV
jgi:hypothetical protein